LEDQSWKDNIKIDFKRTRCEHVGWFYLPQARSQWQAHVNTVMTLWVQ